MDNIIELIAKDGKLYTPPYRGWREPQLLICSHGVDCDTVAWPDYNPKNLSHALYDAREEGLIPDDPFVILPDGTEFKIDA